MASVMIRLFLKPLASLSLVFMGMPVLIASPKITVTNGWSQYKLNTCRYYLTDHAEYRSVEKWITNSCDVTVTWREDSPDLPYGIWAKWRPEQQRPFGFHIDINTMTYRTMEPVEIPIGLDPLFGSGKVSRLKNGGFKLHDVYRTLTLQDESPLADLYFY